MSTILKKLMENEIQIHNHKDIPYKPNYTSNIYIIGGRNVPCNLYLQPKQCESQILNIKGSK